MVAEIMFDTSQPKKGISERLNPRGVFKIQKFDKDGNFVQEWIVPNTIVNQGKNYMLDATFNGASQSSSWYIGLIDQTGFTGISANDVMNSHSGWAESSAYSEATRPAWSKGAAASQSIGNASEVTFAINATVVIKGIFITDNNVKGGTSGKLWSAALAQADISFSSGEQARVTYNVNL